MKKVFAILFLSLALSACNSGNAPSSNISGGQSAPSVATSNPGESVKSMMSLLEKGEVQAAKKLMNKEMQGRNFAAAEARELIRSGIKTLTVDVKSAKGEVAYVVAFIEDKTGYKRQIMFDMIRENGEWRVSGVH